MIDTEPPLQQLRALVVRLTVMLEEAGPNGVGGVELDLDRLGTVLSHLRIARGLSPADEWGDSTGVPDEWRQPQGGDPLGPRGFGGEGDLLT